MLFAGAGYSVFLYDVSATLIENAIKDVEEQLNVLEKTSMLRGKLSAAQQLKLISGIYNVLLMVNFKHIMLTAVL